MNVPTLVVLLIVVAVFVGIIAKTVIDKKKGKSSCSCGCSGCAMKDSCHSAK